MVEKHEMVVIGMARYRYEDAKRLGLVTDGKVITARSVERPPTVTYAHNHAPGDVNADGTPVNAEDPEAKTPQDDPQGTDSERPARNASKDAWKSYALAQGRTEDELKDLTRDQISELFPDESSDNK